MASKTVTLDPGESKEIVFSYTPTEAGLFNVRLDGLMGQLVVTADTRVSGRITRMDNGNALEGAKVEVSGKSTTTDSNGWFHIDDITPGTQTIKVSKNGFNPESITVDVRVGLNNYIGIISLQPIATVGSISGRMEQIDPRGQDYNTLLTNFDFKIDNYSGRTDGQGYFTVEDLPLGHYSKITSEGYIPINIDLDVIGDMDLGIVEMVPTNIQWQIELANILVSGPLAQGEDIVVSVKAVLYLSELNKPVSREVTLVVNGNTIATKTITLTRTSENFPATDEFELASIHLDNAGTYVLEVDGLSETIEVSALPNIFVPLAINEIANYGQLIAQYDNCIARISWDCPLCNRIILLGACESDSTLPEWHPAFEHITQHQLGYISPDINVDEANVIRMNWKDYILRIDAQGNPCKYLACKVGVDDRSGLNECRTLNIYLNSFDMYYNKASAPVFDAEFTSSNTQNEPHLWWAIKYVFIRKEDLQQMINALNTRAMPTKHGIKGVGPNSIINPEWAAVNGVPCFQSSVGPKPGGTSTYCGYEPPKLYLWAASGSLPVEHQGDEPLFSYLQDAPTGDYYVLAIANYYEQGSGEGQIIDNFQALFQKVWVVGEAIL